MKTFTRLITEFVAGATKPSFPALIGAIVIAAGGGLACVTLVTPQRMTQVGYGYFLAGTEDEYGYVTGEVLGICQSNDRGPVVAVVGNSGIREAIANGSEFEAILVQEAHLKPRVALLSTGGLRLLEMVTVVDSIADSIEGVIVLQVSPWHLAENVEFQRGIAMNRRLALDSPMCDEIAREMGVPTRTASGNYFVDHREFFLPRVGAIANLMRGPVTPRLHMAETWRTPTEREWNRAVSSLRLRLEDYPAERDRNLAIYQRIIDRARESGFEIGLLEGVLSPQASRELRADPATRDLLLDYEETISRLAERNDIPYWDLSAAARLKTSDFADHGHVNNDVARRRFTEMLVRAIATSFGEDLVTDQDRGGGR